MVTANTLTYHSKQTLLWTTEKCSPWDLINANVDESNLICHFSEEDCDVWQDQQKSGKLRESRR
ncbi:hypothetical protein DPMN_005397 [Dreissena polymorpha]|uniref:Uncharacterized protein n=1 Tax=Dreissena polymorpha TaxID=45954 RepID=A0A9D4MTE8_DREPO|nr:hypothetical protein DPMN_005397 [Dreissena polymorpha]